MLGIGVGVGGLGATPGGVNTAIQYNNNGALGGGSLTWNNATVTLCVNCGASQNGVLSVGGGGGTSLINLGAATGSDIGTLAGNTRGGGGITISSSGGVPGGLLTPRLEDSGGASATLTGTGACATFSGQVGGQLAGSAACASATAASTLTIGSLTTAAHGYVCYVQDQTTRANLFQQTSNSTTSCTLTATSVTQNDVFVFTAIGF